MIRLLAVAALCSLSGCLGPAEFRGWPEPEFKFAQCSDAPNGMAACVEQARAACPEGYQLAELREDPDINRHAMIFRCGAPPPPEAAPAPAPTRRARSAPEMAPK